MPEGPELSLSRDFLRRIIVGKMLCAVCRTQTGRYADVCPRGFDVPRDKQHVMSVDVKGKFMWWTLGPATPTYVFTTYGMSGQWHTSQTKHTALEISFDDGTGVDGTMLFFNDPRHFGTVGFVYDTEELERKLASLGPDMLNDPPTVTTFIECLRAHPERSLCRALMDQRVISGVGNYIKAESLYAACLSPHRKVQDATDDELSVLRQAIIDVMQASYTLGGTSIRTYTNVDGSQGKMQDRLAVYNKRIDPLGNFVINEKTDDSRTTWWVPNVQR
jgi:DNA-formamidopyrimidine glycosylase